MAHLFFVSFYFLLLHFLVIVSGVSGFNYSLHEVTAFYINIAKTTAENIELKCTRTELSNLTKAQRHLY